MLSASKRLRIILLFVAAVAGMPAASGATIVREAGWITDGTVRTITQANGTIYIGGDFTQVGPPTGGAAELDAATTEVTAPYARVLGSVHAFAPDGAGGYYLGGLFTAVQGQPRSNLAQIDASGNVTPWNPLADGQVDAIDVTGGVVYVGGQFASIGAVPRNYVAAIDASTGVVAAWNPVLDNRVRFIAVHGGSLLYLGGDFTTINGTSQPKVAQFTLPAGTLTSAFAGSTSATLRAMTIALGRLYLSYNGLVVRDATTTALISTGPTLDGPITAVTADPTTGTIYVAGDFTYIGGFLRKGLAALEPSGYTVLDWKPIVYFGKNGPIEALTFAGNQVIAGGTFTNIDNNVRNNLFAADAYPATPLTVNLWNPNPSKPVHTLALNGSKVLVGGDFVTISAARRNYIAAIDPTSGMPRDWNPNANGPVASILVSGTTVYFGGSFTMVQGNTRNRAAAVDGPFALLTAFDPNVNIDFPTEVNALGIYQGLVYMAGSFSTVGGLPRGGLASVAAGSGAPSLWNAGVNGSVYAMRLLIPNDITAPPTVIIGGHFQIAGGAARSNLASINGGTGIANAWNPSANGDVNALVVFANSFGGLSRAYVGGGFSFVGGMARSCLAEINSSGAATAWDPGANNTVYAIAPFGGTVFAGGAFTALGGQSRSHLGGVSTTTGLATAWDPSAALGAPAGFVYSLLALNNTVFAGGSFLTMSGKMQCYFAGVSDETITGAEDEAVPAAPASVVRATPNPFETATTVRFALSKREAVLVTVYDAQGRLVRRLHAGDMGAGPHTLPWDGIDQRGRTAGSGVYFVSVRTPSMRLGSKVYRVR